MSGGRSKPFRSSIASVEVSKVKPIHALGVVTLVTLCAFRAQPASADCQSDARRLDAYEQVQQSEGGYLRAIAPLLVAVRKYEECRAAVPIRSRTWIDETLAEGFDTGGLAMDYFDARSANQARVWEYATFHLISVLCWAKPSLNKHQEIAGRVLVSLYNFSLSDEVPGPPQIPDCFKPAVSIEGKN
jgi:hypothetical protein